MTEPGHQDPLQRIVSAFRHWQISLGFAILDENVSRLANLAPDDPESTVWLLALAQAVDLGYRSIDFLETCRSRFANVDIGHLRFLELLRLRLVDSFQCLSRENLAAAIRLVETVLLAGADIMPPELLFTAHFWKARAHRKLGEYEAALIHVRAACTHAEQCQAPRLLAAARVHESWLLFQKGERRAAVRLLDEAERELAASGHALTLGNIESARGRFVRRSGDYAQALAHFEEAIRIYANGFADHPNCARALVNAAYVKRLIALEIQSGTKGKAARGFMHERYLTIYNQALQLLARAGKIYELHCHHTGIGTVLVNNGHLHLEIGGIEQAAREAKGAYSLGEEKQDPILMARARILQSSVELASAEEQLDEETGTSSRAAMAVIFSDEAIELARQTQNKRLIAAACIARGHAAASDFFQDWDFARSCIASASELLSQNDRDHLLRELTALKVRVLHAAGIDQTLRQWSEGQIGRKTFRQIQEEFAEIVIPRVWVAQGRNITRVAQQLSISPKKIRRILRNVALHENSQRVQDRDEQSPSGRRS
jgi:tetratricopeptide (TPR) repeat protein